MELNNIKIGFALTGSFCTFKKAIPKMKELIKKGADILPIMSYNSYKLDTKFGKAVEFIKEIENAGFDILQIHGELKPEVLNKAVKPIWYAQNIKNSSDIADFGIDQKISALVIDGEKYGGGKTFDWTADAVNKRMDIKIPIVLAGGLNSKNVIDGIEKFQPDIVDVSTGVEGTSGKDKKLILDFIERVKHE